MIENWMVMPIKYKERIRTMKKKSTKKVQPVDKTEETRWKINIYA
tara:strand:- start:860 stop:994 length:135 start_codon:yes stop_codon:yes gene_type:complete